MLVSVLEKGRRARTHTNVVFSCTCVHVERIVDESEGPMFVTFVGDDCQLVCS
jgi:hypothetical protein